MPLNEISVALSAKAQGCVYRHRAIDIISIRRPDICFSPRMLGQAKQASCSGDQQCAVPGHIKLGNSGELLPDRNEVVAIAAKQASLRADQQRAAAGRVKCVNCAWIPVRPDRNEVVTIAAKQASLRADQHRAVASHMKCEKCAWFLIRPDRM
jgi:hypothetical protein